MKTAKCWKLRRSMNDEKRRQVLAGQWEEGVHFIALSIFNGSMSYVKFLSLKPDTKEKKYVDDWLKGQLSAPEYKGKIIPGFNG